MITWIKLYAVVAIVFLFAKPSFAEPVINEFVTNHTGSDTHEFIELFGLADTDYSGLSLLEIEGDGAGAGVVDGVFNIGTTNEQGYWSTGYLSNVLENGSLTLLLVRNFSGSLAEDLDVNNDGVLDSAPWDVVVDAIAVHDGGTADLTYANISLLRDFDSGGNTVGGASRIPNGMDTDAVADWVRNDFHGEGLPGFSGTPELNEALNTPNAENGLPELEPPAMSLAIYEIQGASHVSPVVGERVQTNGVVTAVRSQSYYMQDLQGDNNDATSDAIVVFAGSNHGVAVGDELNVVGTVIEFYPGGFASGNLSTTEIIQPEVTIVSSANPLPSAVVIGTGGRIPPSEIIDDDATGDVNSTGSFDAISDGIDFYESLEAMWVQVNNAIVVDSNRFGEITVLGDDGVNASGLNTRGGVTIASDDFNPERIIIDDAIVFREPWVTVGDKFSASIYGVMDYSFGNYKLFNSDSLPEVISGGLQRESSELQSSPTQLTVASFNVENLDPGDSSLKFNGLANAVVDNLKSPDIIGLQEIQDNSGTRNDGVVDASETYNALIGAIVSAGGPVYEFRDIMPLDNQDGGQPGANIRVGLLYLPDRVTLIERPGGDATTATVVQQGSDGVQLSLSPGRIDPANAAFFDSRKPLVAEFTFNGKKVFVLVNHFNSKGGDDPLFGRVQPPVLVSETMRIQQAAAVNAFVNQILEQDDDANVIVMGDLNDFPFSPALTALSEEEGLTNLVAELPLSEQYSYIYEGNSQSLDHVLVSENLLEDHQAELDIVHVNAEFHNRSRSSDHDPLLARFCMDTEEPELDITLTPEYLWPPDNKYVTVTASVSVHDEDPNVAVKLLGIELEDSDRSHQHKAPSSEGDIIIVDDFTFKLRARHGNEYKIRYSAMDTCGNDEKESASISVSKPKHRHH